VLTCARTARGKALHALLLLKGAAHLSHSGGCRTA
jgi:hypothetical protein